jgi:hypothetical protein
MADPARHANAAFGSALVCLLWVQAPAVTVRLDSGQLRVAAPGIRFLSGRALERLENGATVIFPIQLTLLTDSKNLVRHRAAARFAVSFDLWEERFSVTRLGAPGRGVSHLTAAAAETWCLDNLPIPAAGLADRTPFWVRLEIRAEQPGQETANEDGSTFNLTRLVELFSRPLPSGQAGWRDEAGPLRLAELKKP